jgi:hypothetical protein
MINKLKQIFWILGIIGANGIIVLNIFFYLHRLALQGD